MEILGFLLQPSSGDENLWTGRKDTTAVFNGLISGVHTLCSAFTSNTQNDHQRPDNHQAVGMPPAVIKYSLTYFVVSLQTK
jgi:hypothetical protein